LSSELIVLGDLKRAFLKTHIKSTMLFPPGASKCFILKNVLLADLLGFGGEN
jgi:hypothetical protein